MTNSGKILGIEKVSMNLNKKLAEFTVGSMKGMIESAALIRYDMEKTPPYIPIDTGNLRASWTVNSGYIGKNPIVVMGFTAEYAVYVHENMEPSVKWSRPGSGPKFFEAAFKRNTQKMIRLIGGKK